MSFSHYPDWKLFPQVFCETFPPASYVQNHLGVFPLFVRVLKFGIGTHTAALLRKRSGQVYLNISYISDGFQALEQQVKCNRALGGKRNFLQLFLSAVIISCSFQFSLFVMLQSMIVKALLFMVKETAVNSWHILWPFLLQGHTIICVNYHRSWKVFLFNVSWQTFCLWPTIAYIRAGQFCDAFKGTKREWRDDQFKEIKTLQKLSCCQNV